MHIMQNATFQHHKHYLIIAGADEWITYTLLTSLCDTVRSLGASSFGETGESDTTYTTEFIDLCGYGWFSFTMFNFF